mgnify:FL=1
MNGKDVILDIHGEDKLDLYSVFGVARGLPKNYVYRESVDGALERALRQNKHIVIHGTSKQGKTCLRKRVLENKNPVVVQCLNERTLEDLYSLLLKEVGYEVLAEKKNSVSGGIKVSLRAKVAMHLFGKGVDAEGGVSADGSAGVDQIHKPIDIDLRDVNDVIRALSAVNCSKYIILEDFHYLPEKTQLNFAVALKAFHELSDYTFIVVGVWRNLGSISMQNGDLEGRIITVDADKWTRSELLEVIQKGEQLMNIKIDCSFKEGLVDSCFGSVFVVQEACAKVCDRNKLLETQDDLVAVGGDVSEIVKDVINSNSRRYIDFIDIFSKGIRTRKLSLNKWVLRALIEEGVDKAEKGIALKELRQTISSKHPSGDAIASPLQSVLKNTLKVQVKNGIKPIVLEYDRRSRLLSVVDKTFLIWMRYADCSEVIEQIGFPED